MESIQGNCGMIYAVKVKKLRYICTLSAENASPN
jgi:hypothetical protein